MSDFLIETTDVARNLLLVFGYVVIVLGILYLYREIRQDSYNKKINKCEKKKNKIRDDFIKEITHIDSNPFSKIEEYSKSIAKKKAKKEEEIYECDNEINEYKRKAYKSKENSNIIISSVMVMLVVLFLLICFVRSHICGSIDYITAVENNVNQDIAITAYYEVEYEGIPQKTLTVFVRNNSQRTLENAKLKETSSGNTIDVKTLEPGEEKIVSINVYSSRKSNYEFELSDIKFIE